MVRAMGDVNARGRCGLAGCCLWVAGCLSVPATEAPPELPAAEDAPRVVWKARSIADFYAVGEVRAFELRQGGQTLGMSWGRYLGRDPETSVHRFETRIELRVPGRGELRSAGELGLDERGRVVSGFERSPGAELTFVREGSSLVFHDGARTDEVAYEPERTETAVMAHSAILHEELMFGLRTLVEGEQSWRLLSLSGGPPLDWHASVGRRGEDLVIDTSLGERISWSDGRIQEVYVDASDLHVLAVKDPSWPEWAVEGPERLAYAVDPSAPFVLRELELAGKPDEPRLWGEVLVPKGAQPAMGAVLYVSSTGQEDRHGFAGPPPVDLGSHEITDALARAGFVVLRFDERGKGKSEAAPGGFLAQVEDARRAFRTLLVQPEVDPNRVVVVGHGEGGLRALHVVAGQRVAGIALLAVPGRPYRAVFAYQSARAMEQLPPELRPEAEKTQRQMLEAIAAGKAPPPELAGQATWIREMLEQQPARLLAQVDAPVFVGQGGKDFEVDPAEDLKAVLVALPQATDAEVHRYPRLDHLFKVESGRSDPARYLVRGRPVDPAFLRDLVDWASQSVLRAAASEVGE